MRLVFRSVMLNVCFFVAGRYVFASAEDEPWKFSVSHRLIYLRSVDKFGRSWSSKAGHVFRTRIP